jgi:hypothetical protein
MFRTTHRHGPWRATIALVALSTISLGVTVIGTNAGASSGLTPPTQGMKPQRLLAKVKGNSS